MSFPRYERYKESGHKWLGCIPEHWREERLKRVCLVVPSNVDKKTQEGEPAVRLCNYTDVYYNDFIVSGMEFMVASATPAQIAKFELRKGDVLVTKDSETADDIGVAAYVSEDLEGVLCGYHLALLRPDKDLNGYFLKLLFGSRYVKSVFSVSANGLTRVALGQDDLRSLLLPIPPLAEQKRIVASLRGELVALDALVAEQERLIELLQEKRQAVITQAVTKGLDPDVPMKPSGVEWLGSIPQEWKAVPLVSVARLESGHTPSRQHPEYWENCTIPWCTLADIWQVREGGAEVISETQERVSELGVAHSAARVLPAGTVMLSRTASVGFAAIMGQPMATSQDFANWVCSERIESRYLLYVFKAMRGEFDRRKMGSTHNTIYMPDIRALRTPLPPRKDQVAIVERIALVTRGIDRLAEDAQRAIDLLRERRSALITAAVTGQIDVRGLVPQEAQA